MTQDPAAPRSPAAFTEADVAALFAPYADLADGGVVLAVSGGSDSMGLMHLFARWLDARSRGGRRAPPVHVATIDHALRPSSAADAGFVVAAAQRLGFHASSARWEGPKPTSGLSEAARDARYRLLADAMRAAGARVLMTAHTLDDQAETLLMRLARGSGVDGLAGMAPLRPLADPADCWLARPLLGVEKVRIAADLAAHGIGFRPDPTNVDPAYERPRLRAAEGTLRALGLTPTSLGRAAARMRRVSEALDAIVTAALLGGGVEINPLGCIALDLGWLREQPEEIALRLVRRSIEIAGGASVPVALASLEDLVADLRARSASAWTLARAALQVKGERLLVEREPGRQPPPRSSLRAGWAFCWDGRFDVEVARCETLRATCLEVGPLGAEGIAILEAQDFSRPDVSARTLRAVPAVWRRDDLVAAPLLGFAGGLESAGVLQLDCRMTFRGRSLTRGDETA